MWWMRPSRVPPLAGASCRGCNVLLVTIDTLRADRVGAFGSTARPDAALDRLGAEGLRFTRAYTHAPLTLPSHASLLTARLAAGARRPRQRPVPTRRRRCRRWRPCSRRPATAPARSSARSCSTRASAWPAASTSTTIATARRRPATPKAPSAAARRSSARRATGSHRIRNPLKPAVRNPQSAMPWFAWVHLYDPARSLPRARALRVAARALRRARSPTRTRWSAAARSSVGRRASSIGR